MWLLGACAAVGARVKLWDISGWGIACVTWVDTWNSTCRGRATSQPGLSQSGMCVGRVVLCCRVFGERSGFCAPVVFPSLSLMAPADGPEGCDPVSHVVLCRCRMIRKYLACRTPEWDWRSWSCLPLVSEVGWAWKSANHVCLGLDPLLAGPIQLF